MADGIDLTTNEETALLPCPFCGGSPKIEYHEHSDDAWIPEKWPLYFELGCTNKDCLLHGLIYMRQYWPNNPENLKMIRAWNSRSPGWKPMADLPDGRFRFIGWIHPDDRDTNDQAYVEYERIGKEYRRIDDGRPCGEPKFFTLLTPPEAI